MMLKFGTLSVCIGNQACNARCDYCVARMTPNTPTDYTSNSRYDLLGVACRLAEKGGVTTALLTGKGEPTLFEDEITYVLVYLKDFFPIIELQTNGINFGLHPDEWWLKLGKWRANGLTTVAISVVHWNDEQNRQIFCDDAGQFRFNYPPLADTIRMLHSVGLSVRLNIVGIRNYIDNYQTLQQFVEWAKELGVEQVTWRPVGVPEHSRNKVADRARELQLTEHEIAKIRNSVHRVGTLLYRMEHGAEIYSVPTRFGEQNLALTNCLTRQPDSDVIRQLIYMSGHLYYDWEHEGAIIV